MLSCRLRPVLLGLLLSMVAATGALAFEIDPPLPDPAQEARAQQLFKLLRCLVCQNQSIADSNAPLARDLRLIVRERVASGDGDDEVVDFVVNRYGNWVLLEPPFGARTLLLWLGPFAVLLIAVGAVWLAVRRRRTRPGAEPGALSAAEAERVAWLLDEPEDAR